MNSSMKEMFKFGTDRIIGLLEALNEEDWFVQPPGFANNIAWNAGHLLLVRQNLVYRSSGLDSGLPKEWNAMYKGGSSPADWDEPHKPADILNAIKQLHSQFLADIDNNSFDNVEYNKFDIRGTPINSPEDGAMFSLWHEALHLGQMIGIKDTLEAKN